MSRGDAAYVIGSLGACAWEMQDRRDGRGVPEIVRNQRRVLAMALAKADEYLAAQPGWDANGAPL